MRCARKIILPLLLAGPLLLLSGCRFIDWNGSNSNDDHREEWLSRSDGDYSFVMNRGCFCFLAGRFDVEVADYEIVSMVSLDTGESISSDNWDYVHTIEEMFDLIDEADEGADVLRVKYAREGYPTEIQIDWYEQAADDEIWYGVSDVVIH